MILYLYKLGTNTPALTIKNARSYTAASTGQLHTGIITATVIEMNPTEELMTEPAVTSLSLLPIYFLQSQHFRQINPIMYF